jgi:hypothetical protein
MAQSADEKKRDRLWEEDDGKEPAVHLNESYTEELVRSAVDRRAVYDHLHIFVVGFWSILKGLLGIKP